MRFSLGKKIFAAFFVLLVITFALSLVVLRSARDLQTSTERVVTVKEFQVRLARIGSLSQEIIDGEGGGDLESFERELEIFLEFSKMIDSFDTPLEKALRDKVRDLPAMVGYYRQAYDELFRRHRENHAFRVSSAGLQRNLLDLGTRVTPADRAEYHRLLHQYGLLQEETYLNSDASGIVTLKETGAALSDLAGDDDISSLLEHFTRAVEKNYLVALAIADRKAFLAETSETFSALSSEIIHAINADSVERQRHNTSYTRMLMSFFFVSTFGALFLFIRYTRLVTGSLSHAISSIRKEHYDYHLSRVPRDEFGDLMLFMKELSLALRKSISAARNSEQFLQEIIDGIAEPIMLIGLDYRVQLVNRAARENTATSFDGSGNLLCYQVSHHSEVPCSGENHSCPLECVAATGKATTVQHIHTGKTGDQRIIEIVASPLFDSNGTLKGIIEAGRDITDRRQIEEALVRANREIEERCRELQVVDKLKDNLIRDVSHELKTPVAKHAMQLEILRPLLEKHRLAEKEEKAFAVMEESIRRQESVIRNLLDLSRLESGRRRYRTEPLRLDTLLSRVHSDYLYAIEQCGGSVELAVPEITISSDSDMLWHLFSNVMNNAIKFRKKGQAVRIAVSARTDGDLVTIRIDDDGVGLSQSDKEMVFERFYQSSASVEGSGVGLTICRMIAEDLGGGIEIESAGQNLGASVIVTLPTAGPDRSPE